ncbi:MAG TPA: MarR family winged helix-turn-helix transcriptional regulator [Gemmatimonadales bacterium]|nr:MarR family winged helix-turn-helix transcriptional regulator [Gemmatimonadales bacterium]
MQPHRRAAQIMAADCLCFRARRASRGITRLYDDVLRPLGIHATQLTLLSAIAMCGPAGTMGHLADILAMDATTLSRNLRPLVAMKLVRLGRHPDDRRMRVAQLTPAGERMVAEALPLWTDAHRRVVSILGSETAADLRDLFDTAAAATAGSSFPPPERPHDEHDPDTTRGLARRVAGRAQGAARRREGVHPRP